MTRRIKRTRDFEVTVQLKNENYISPPHDSQRNWLLGRAMNEFSRDLMALDTLAKRFVPGATDVPLGDREHAPLAQEEIMEDWQFPIMKAMADIVTAEHGDVLEVGYGRGVSAQYIQEQGVRSHTLIECNDSIVRSYEGWRVQYPDRDIRMIHALWQEAGDRLETYDGVFFHTYPLNEEELVENVIGSTTFAEHFFPTAAKVLRPGGVFTYMTNEMDSFSREHQRLLFRDFRNIRLEVVRDLKIPQDVKDAWWADSMVVVRAQK